MLRLEMPRTNASQCLVPSLLLHVLAPFSTLHLPTSPSPSRWIPIANSREWIILSSLLPTLIAYLEYLANLPGEVDVIAVAQQLALTLSNRLCPMRPFDVKL